ncbi:transcriptional regulator [Sideroxydans lithotrophicus]|nr:helix-turn-helix domain-containing protein [Sideroxydans lithotrophicus]
MKTNPIIQAGEAVGGLGVLARILSVSAPTVSQWKSGIRPIPAERCVEIEQATSGQVTRKDLRPDDWQQIWPELIGKKAA